MTYDNVASQQAVFIERIAADRKIRVGHCKYPERSRDFAFRAFDADRGASDRRTMGQ